LRNLIGILVVGMMVSGLLTGGCGGGDGGQVDKASFVEEANAICKQASGKLAAKTTLISRRESANPNADFNETQVTLVEDGLVPSMEEEMRKIHALGIPSDAKREVEAFLAAYEKAIADIKKDPKAATGTTAPYEPVELTGTAFGVSECPISAVASAG
jgi:hypothetical protein